MPRLNIRTVYGTTNALPTFPVIFCFRTTKKCCVELGVTLALPHQNTDATLSSTLPKLIVTKEPFFLIFYVACSVYGTTSPAAHLTKRTHTINTWYGVRGFSVCTFIQFSATNCDSYMQNGFGYIAQWYYKEWGPGKKIGATTKSGLEIGLNTHLDNRHKHSSVCQPKYPISKQKFDLIPIRDKIIRKRQFHPKLHEIPTKKNPLRKAYNCCCEIGSARVV